MQSTLFRNETLTLEIMDAYREIQKALVCSEESFGVP